MDVIRALFTVTPTPARSHRYVWVVASLALAGCFDASKLMSGGSAGPQGSDESDAEGSETGEAAASESEASEGESDATSGSENEEEATASSMAADEDLPEEGDPTTGGGDSTTGSPTEGGEVTTTVDPDDGGPDAGGESDESDSGATAPPFVENEGADCATGSPPVPGAAHAGLSDPFEGWNNQRISTAAQWRCRRQEILKTAEAYVYGEKPPKPERVTGFVSETEISVEVTHEGSTISFGAAVELPASGSPPFPALIGIGGVVGLSTSVLSDEGIALITLDPDVVGDAEGSRSSKLGGFYTLYGADSPAGLLVAWAWGVSRMLDVVEDSGGDILRPDAMGVTGCSRYGKGAFVAGAFDQRIALTIPVESGTGGVPIWRGVDAEDGALSLAGAFTETYWLGDAFEPFTDDVETLPLDNHEIIAMVAPRGLLVLDNPHLALLGPVSGHVAALAGAEIYAALQGSGNLGYHSAVESGSHCAAKTEQTPILRESLQRHLTKTGNAGGTITAHTDAVGELSSWIDWTAPTLE